MTLRLILGGILALLCLAAFGSCWIAVLLHDLGRAKEACDRERGL